MNQFSNQFLSGDLLYDHRIRFPFHYTSDGIRPARMPQFADFSSGRVISSCPKPEFGFLLFVQYRNISSPSFIASFISRVSSPSRPLSFQLRALRPHRLIPFACALRAFVRRAKAVFIHQKNQSLENFARRLTAFVISLSRRPAKAQPAFSARKMANKQVLRHETTRRDAWSLWAEKAKLTLTAAASFIW